MTAALRWEEPPPPKPPGRVSVYGPILDELLKRPGEWAHIGTSATVKQGYARAQSLRHAARARDLYVETAVRQVEKHGRLYARITK